MALREPSHAGSWYSNNASQLTSQLDEWLSKATNTSYPGARAVIAPHAGYSYSGPTAAWAYRYLDLSKAKRIFILHPSHHVYLDNAALPTVSGYLTPLSTDPLPLDHSTIKALGRDRKLFGTMSRSVDEDEHSGEMQLPYIHRLLQRLYPNKSVSTYPPLVPIMIGNTSPAVEKALGAVLAPYINDEQNAFVISSDFCHWGPRFRYTYYLADAPSPETDAGILPNGPRGDQATAQETSNEDIHKIPTLQQGLQLRSSSAKVTNPKIYESIAHVDRACMCAIASGEHDEFLRVLSETGNTVCGRHPIGVFMAGIEEIERSQARDETDALKGRFRFLRYARSDNVLSVKDSSVSYVSAVAVL